MLYHLLMMSHSLYKVNSLYKRKPITFTLNQQTNQLAIHNLLYFVVDFNFRFENDTYLSVNNN